jgi:hypothetical protein
MAFERHSSSHIWQFRQTLLTRTWNAVIPLHPDGREQDFPTEIECDEIKSSRSVSYDFAPFLGIVYVS